MPGDESHWSHALRASIDAVVLQFEAQVRALHELQAQRDAALRAELAGRLDALRAELAARDEALRVARAELAAKDEALRTLDSALQREAAEGARLRDAVRTLEEEAHRARRSLAEKSQELDVLGEQFAAEASFVEGARLAAASVLFDALGAALGAPLEPTPQCYGALKSRRMDAVLGAAMRERGRTVARAPLTDAEQRALSALAAAAGCELVTVAAGTRYASSSMEKVGTRTEPADEDLVVECALAGLRLSGAAGLAVQPRVIVGAA